MLMELPVLGNTLIFFLFATRPKPACAGKKECGKIKGEEKK